MFNSYWQAIILIVASARALHALTLAGESLSSDKQVRWSDYLSRLPQRSLEFSQKSSADDSYYTTSILIPSFCNRGMLGQFAFVSNTYW